MKKGPAVKQVLCVIPCLYQEFAKRMRLEITPLFYDCTRKQSIHFVRLISTIFVILQHSQTGSKKKCYDRNYHCEDLHFFTFLRSSNSACMFLITIASYRLLCLLPYNIFTPNSSIISSLDLLNASLSDIP